MPTRQVVAVAVVLIVAVAVVAAGFLLPTSVSSTTGDVLALVYGTLALFGVGWIVRSAAVESRDDEDDRLREALSSLGPPERWLWRAVVRRNLARPGTRLSRWIPRYGLRGATQAVVGNVWLIFAYLLFPSIALQGRRAGPAATVIVQVLAGFGLIGLLFAFYRIVTSARSIRRYRRSLDEPNL